MDAYRRHQQYMRDYAQYYGGSSPPPTAPTSAAQTEHDLVRQHHQFLRDPNADAQIAALDGNDRWAAQLAKAYYDRLFKEYCLGDLSRYKTGQVALRWRTHREVVAGKGQWECGNLVCSERSGLKSWEVLFGYVEQGEKKSALVKLRLCPDCSRKLHYKKDKERRRQRRERTQDTDDDERELVVQPNEDRAPLHARRGGSSAAFTVTVAAPTPPFRGEQAKPVERFASFAR
ncbi:hypothetical protein GGF31_007193 [Allomyces arbusculus]|nr:hypothetical protein GGF31_007193 [Allomyces arbusculus]